jgi:hypothetical protein
MSMPSIPVTIIGVMTYTDSPGAPGSPPVISGGPGSLPPWAMPPIAPGGRPPGIWGGPGGLPPSIMPPIAPGGQPPRPSQGPGFPTHPIAPGGQPPGIGGGPSAPPGTQPMPPMMPGGPPSGEEGSGKWVWSPVYGWVWMEGNSGEAPDQGLPPDQPGIDNTLPGGGTPQPKS